MYFPVIIFIFVDWGLNSPTGRCSGLDCEEIWLAFPLIDRRFPALVAKIAKNSITLNKIIKGNYEIAKTIKSQKPHDTKFHDKTAQKFWCYSLAVP